MKIQIALFAAIAATALFAIADRKIEKLPAAWEISGDSPKSYESGIDRDHARSKSGAKFLRFVSGSGTSWAVLAQKISAELYRGKRVRFQAMVKTKDVDQYWAGLWFRVDKAELRSAMLYNSIEKPMTGSNDWALRTAVFDIPLDATVLAFGVISGGRSQVWMDELQFDIVGDDVPVSKVDIAATTKAETLPKRPSL